MAREGKIPVSTLKQRRRQKGTSGSCYGVEASLRDALKFGYIGPNLPAPLGRIWRSDGGGVWRLGLMAG